jgi:hypothetical protein
MIERCARCAAGPADVSGHDDLYMHAFVASSMTLRCRTCGTCWVRKPGRTADTFEWIVGDESQGALVPASPLE